MRKILIPIDGSPQSLRAVHHVLDLARERTDVEVHVLNVQPPLPTAASDFINRQDVQAFHREEGETALREARGLLDRAGIRYEAHVAVGDSAEAIVDYATTRKCDQIVMGSRGLSPLPSLLLGSTTTKVLHLVHLPVTVVR